MQYSPDGYVYLVSQGATDPDPEPRDANLSWITGDQIYLARVKPSIPAINDASQYEYFAGHDSRSQPVWTHDFAKIKPLLDWNNHMGSVTITYDAPLKLYLMAVTDGHTTISKFDTYILEAADYRTVEAGGLHEELWRAGIFCEFSVEIHQPGWPDRVAFLLGKLYEWTERHPLLI